jgi:hypothetical protein
VTATPRKKRDPIFGAAVLKLTFQRRHDEQSPQFKAIYEGVIRDLKVTDEDVNVFLQAHLAEIEDAIRAHGRGEMGDGPDSDED